MANIAADTFTGSPTDTSLPTHDAAWVNHASGSAGWRTTSGGRARGNGTNAVVYRNVTPPSADYSVSADIVIVGAGVAGNAVEITGRGATGALTYYGARLAFSSGSSANWQLHKRVAGTYTQLGSNVSQTVATSDVYRLLLEMSGDQISLYVDGVLKVGPITDTAITAAGVPGLRDNAAPTDSTGYHVDNWSADTLGGGGGSAIAAISSNYKRRRA